MAERKTFLWARLSVHHTKKTCLASCMLPFSALSIIIFFRLFVQNQPTGKDYFVKRDIVTQREDARDAARSEFVFEGLQDNPNRKQQDDERNLVVLFRNTKSGGEPGKYEAEDINFEISSQNVLTREGLARLKSVEDEIVKIPGYEKLCWIDRNSDLDCGRNASSCALQNSITNHPMLYGVKKGDKICGRRSTTEPVTQEKFDLFMKDMIVRGKPNPLFSSFLGKDFSASNKRTQIIRSFILFGKPLKSEMTPEDEEKALDEYAKWSANAEKKIEDKNDKLFHFLPIGEEFFNSSFQSIILRDLSFAVASILLVFIVIWIHTSSGFLAFTALSQIILAFPLTYFVYRVIFQVKYFAALQIMTIFLILGIGADDVFVFTDAWKQSAVVLGSDATLEDRMTWTYRRAVKAMSVTSFTTSVAFFVTAFSPIMPISTLGIWAGLLILLQFVLVITIYPCATIIWYQFWRVRKWTNCLKAPKQDSEVTKASESTPSSEKLGLFSKLLKRRKRNEHEYRPIEKFFNGPWTRWMNASRIPILVVGLVLVAGSIYFATRLETPIEQEKFLPDSFPAQNALNLLRTAFPVIDGSTKTRVIITWGIEGIDRRGTSRYNPLDIGKSKLDPQFSMRSSSGQQRILEACKYFSDESKGLLTTEPTLNVKKTCWIEDFQAWRKLTKKGDTFSNYRTEKELIGDLIDFGTWKDSRGFQPFFKYLRGQNIGFNKNRTKVLFTEISFITDLERGSPFSVTRPVFDQWQKELSKFNEGTSDEGVKRPFATGGIQWTFMITQKALINNMFLGIGVVLAVSLFSLSISTGNIIVSILSLVSIGGILTNVLALIFFYGWSLGITESIGVVISIGFSFDYVAHIANAYVESHATNRTERTRDALTDLGVSVLAGAISTLLAGGMLFFATIIFFLKFGIFVFMTVALSLVWGLVFFPCLLLAFGPVNKTGELMPVVSKLLSCFNSKKDNQEENKP